MYRALNDIRNIQVLPNDMGGTTVLFDRMDCHSLIVKTALQLSVQLMLIRDMQYIVTELPARQEMNFSKQFVNQHHSHWGAFLISASVTFIPNISPLPQLLYG